MPRTAKLSKQMATTAQRTTIKWVEDNFRREENLEQAIKEALDGNLGGIMRTALGLDSSFGRVEVDDKKALGREVDAAANAKAAKIFKDFSKSFELTEKEKIGIKKAIRKVFIYELKSAAASKAHDYAVKYCEKYFKSPEILNELKEAVSQPFRCLDALADDGE